MGVTGAIPGGSTRGPHTASHQPAEQKKRQSEETAKGKQLLIEINKALSTEGMQVGEEYFEEGARDGFNKEERMRMVDWAKSDDPTVQFYLARIFGNLGDEKREMHFVDKAIETTEHVALLTYKAILLIKKARPDEAEIILDYSTDRYPGDLNLFCVAIEFCLMKGDFPRAADLLKRVESLHPLDDPRVLILKYLVGRSKGLTDVGLLRSAIKADPLYYKSYVYLGNQIMGTEESAEAYKKATECARNFDELFAAFQLSGVVEAQNELAEAFPSIFHE